jgi:hypothetical protein
MCELRANWRELGCDLHPRPHSIQITGSSEFVNLARYDVWRLAAVPCATCASIDERGIFVTQVHWNTLRHIAAAKVCNNLMTGWEVRSPYRKAAPL